MIKKVKKCAIAILNSHFVCTLLVFFVIIFIHFLSSLVISQLITCKGEMDLKAQLLRSNVCTAARRQSVKWLARAASGAYCKIVTLMTSYFQTQSLTMSVSIKKPTVSKGKVLLDMGKIKKLEDGGEDGKFFQCQMVADCDFTGQTVADVARHITGSHKRKGPPLPGLFNPQPAAATPAGKRGKRKAEEEIAGDEKRAELDDDETLMDIRRILEDSDMETDPGVVGMDGVLRPTSPDKTYRLQPSEEIMKENISQDNFFLETKVGEDSEALAIPIPKVKVDETEDIDDTSKYLICDICGPNQPVWDTAGTHMFEQHRDVLVYAPHLWIGDMPAYMVAPMTEKTDVKALVSCIAELRQRVEKDEAYFTKREDSVGFYKTSLTAMMEKMEMLKKQGEAAMKKLTETNEAHETVLAAVEDKEGEAKMLKSRLAIMQGQNQKMNEKIREQRLLLAEEKKKNSMASLAGEKSSESAAKTADRINKLEASIKFAEQKVVLHQSKVKKLQEEAIKTARDKVEVEKQLKDANDLLCEYAADLAAEEDVPMEVEDNPCSTAEEEEDSDSSTESESEDSSSEEPEKKKVNKKRKCVFFEKKSGCKKGDKCLFLHPTEECKDFLQSKCEGKCLKHHDYEKKKDLKGKKEDGTAKKDKKKSKSKDCLAWMEGRCPHHRKGKTSCEAGKHDQEKWATKEVKGNSSKSQVEVSASPALKKEGKVKGSGVKPSFAPAKSTPGKSKLKLKVKKSKKAKKAKE